MMKYSSVHTFFNLLLCLVSLFATNSCGGSFEDLPALDEKIPKSGFYPNKIQLDLPTDKNCKLIYSLDGAEIKVGEEKRNKFFIKSCKDCALEQISEETKLFKKNIQIGEKVEKEYYLYDIPNSYRHFKKTELAVPVASIFRAKMFCEKDTLIINPRTYFIGNEFLKFKGLPLISLHTSPSNLYDYYKGINVPGYLADSTSGNYNENYHQRGRGWEREVYMEYFDEKGEVVLSQNMGLRIHGLTSREFVNRSFRLYARKKYGSKVVNFPQFKKEQKSVKLRSAGQDQKNLFFRDALASRLFKNSELTIEDYSPINLFINGEYWGLFNLRERFDKHYLSQKKGIHKDSVEIIKGWFDAANNSSYLNFRNGLAEIDVNSDKFYDFVTNTINLESFLEHKISEIYFGRWDVAHWKIWRDKTAENSKWRWVLWDFDVGLGLPNEWGPDWSHGAKVEANYLKPFLTTYKTDRENYEFKIMMKNERIKGQFVQRFMQLLNTNLSKSNILREVDEIVEMIKPVMPFHIDRWSAVNGISSMEEWERNISKLKSFIEKRQDVVIKQLQEYFGLEEPVLLKIKNTDSDEKINGQSLSFLTQFSDQSGFWEGYFFKEFPIEVQSQNSEVYFNGDKVINEKHIFLNHSKNTLEFKLKP